MTPPAKIRLNVTRTPDEDSSDYVICSLFSSDNGEDWRCTALGVTFGAEWFENVFGPAELGRRIEFGIRDPRDVVGG